MSTANDFGYDYWEEVFDTMLVIPFDDFAVGHAHHVYPRIETKKMPDRY